MTDRREEDVQPLQKLCGRFAGRRGFIIGNGPSLRAGDLDRLHAHGEVTLACNKIFLIFQQTAWRPTVYAVEDQGVARSSRTEFGEHFSGNIVYADYLEEHIPEKARYAAFRLKHRVAPPRRPSFSVDFAEGVVCGGTVTYSLLQLAHWLGLSEVYLLGVDFNYTLNGLRPSDEFKGFKTYTPDDAKNYFAEGYVKPGEAHIAPDMESSLCAFQAARQKADSSTRFKIFNATRGGNLEAFPRIDFDTLFPQPPPTPAPPPPALAPPENLAAHAGLGARLARRELVELTEAAYASDAGTLRLYSFADRLSEGLLETNGPHAKAEVGSVEILGSEARTLFLHPPVKIGFTIPAGRPGRLITAMAMHPDVWLHPDIGPCRFLVRIDGAVASDVILDVRRAASRRWHWINLDVKESQQGQHVIEFATAGVGSIAYRWALWRAPLLVWAEPEADKHVEFSTRVTRP